MLALSMIHMLLVPLVALVSLLGTGATPTPDVVPRYGNQGLISTPANGTKIAPGQAFDFKYNIRSDYCTSSLNFTVWLATTPSFGMLGGDASGYYFGRFSEESYPTNPNPVNPCPKQLTMPNFATSPGGTANGESASNQNMYLVVMEEWATCQGSLGRTLSLAYSEIVYNATVSA